MAVQHKAIRPDGIAYWVNDRPPMPPALMVAVQHVAFLGSLMTLSVVLGRAAGLDIMAEADRVALTMIGAGVGVVLRRSTDSAAVSVYLLPCTCHLPPFRRP